MKRIALLLLVALQLCSAINTYAMSEKQLSKQSQSNAEAFDTFV